MSKLVPITPLKRARFLSGLRQYEVARLLGLAPSGYCLRERGDIPVSAREATRLSKILKIPVEELFKKDAG